MQINKFIRLVMRDEGVIELDPYSSYILSNRIITIITVLTDVDVESKNLGEVGYMSLGIIITFITTITLLPTLPQNVVRRFVQEDAYCDVACVAFGVYERYSIAGS